jgi:hypothetical protein
MKARNSLTLRLCAIFVIFVTAAAILRAADPAPAKADATGNWKWTISMEGGMSIDHSAKLKQDGEKITGTFLDGFDNATFDIKDGTIKDGQISFNVVRSFDQGSLTLGFSGKLEGDSIKGKMNMKFGEEPMSFDWDAKRVKEQAPATKPAT